MDRYHINIFYSPRDGGYVADIPDLEACSAFGESPAQALEELEIAKADLIDEPQPEVSPHRPWKSWRSPRPPGWRRHVARANPFPSPAIDR